MPRVRLQRDSGGFYESSELSQADAEALHRRYFQAILQQGQSMRPATVVEGGGSTYGLPASWLNGQIVSVSLAP